MKTYKILYWDLGKSSFVVKDLEILRSEFTVIDFTFKAKNNLSILLVLVKQFFISFYYVFSCKILICQFSGYHSLIPCCVFKLFGKKRIIIAGGTDCVAFPSIQYGNFQKKYLKWFTKKSFQLANIISPVDESLIHYSYTYQNNDFKEQGYRAHIKKINAEDKVIYNGYDAAKFSIINIEREKKSFLTVGANLSTKFGQQLKGIDLVIEMAKIFPDCSFSIIGGKNLSISDKPDNLKLLENVENSKLVNVYNDYAFYMQLSMSEGFPNALCEAMLCGCVPIVTNVGAMKKIVNGEGYVLERKDTELLKKLLSAAISDGVNQSKQMKVRDLIRNRFVIDKRKTELCSLTADLINH